MTAATVDLRDVERERRRNRALAHLLDEQFAVPGTSLRFGIEPIIGLLPVVGDYAGLVLGSLIVLRAIRQGASWPVVARMAVNLAAEAGIGTVPLLGDGFAFVFKANTRNVRLLEADLVDPLRARRRSRTALVGVVVGVLAGLLLLGVLALVVVFLLLRRLF